MTGGTALSEYYFQHRLSEDLDFFSEDELPINDLEDFSSHIAKKIKALREKKTRTGFIRYTFTGSFGELKVDFVHQIFHQLEHCKKVHNLQLASLWDITIDKLYTIFGRLNARDFVDLYFCMKETEANIEQLLSSLEEKYEAKFDMMSLLSRFPAAKDVTDYPKMLVPFNKQHMIDFFLKEVKKLEGEIFK